MMTAKHFYIMERSQVIATTRTQIAQAETGKALQTLSSYLASAPEPDAEWNDTVLLLRARYEKLRQDETLGIVDSDEARVVYNQLNHQILEVVEKLENGQPPPSEVDRSNKRLWWALVGLTVALLAIALIVFLGNRRMDDVVPPPEPEPEPTGNACPVFDQRARFNILVLPFKPLQGDLTQTHAVIKDRLAAQSEQFGIPVSVRTGEIDVNDSNLYPSNGEQAAAIGRPCRAQLVIWGSTESLRRGQIVLTRFKFIDSDSLFRITKLQMTEDLEVDTITSLTSIATEGLLTQEVEWNIQLLFGLITHENNQDSVTLALLENTPAPDTASQKLRQLILADTYVRLNQEEKAIAAYTEILEQDPGDTLALNNRALLLYKKGEYESAALDLSEAIERQPEDASLRISRAAAYLKADRLDKAAEDLEEPPRSLSPKSGTQLRTETNDQLERLRREYQQKMEEQEAQQRAANKTLQSNPSDVQALYQKAKASKNIGDYQAASQAAERILKIDPDNAFAFATLIEIKREMLDTVAARRLMEQAERQRVPASQIIRAAPSLQRTKISRDRN